MSLAVASDGPNAPEGVGLRGSVVKCRARMASLELSVEIAAPPDRVFVLLVPQRVPLWYGTELEARIQVEGGAADFRPGLKLRVVGWRGKREFSYTAEVARYEWGAPGKFRCAALSAAAKICSSLGHEDHLPLAGLESG